MKILVKLAYGNTLTNELMHSADMWERGKWSYSETIQMYCTPKDTFDVSTICQQIGDNPPKEMQPLAVWCPDNPEIKPWVKQGVQTISDGQKFVMFADFLRLYCGLEPITDEQMFVTGIK